MGTGYRIRERNVFVLFAVPSSLSMLRRALHQGERAGRLSRQGRTASMRWGSSTAMAEQHVHLQTSRSLQLSTKIVLSTLKDVMALLMVLRSPLFSICSCSAFFLWLSLADDINTACVGVFSLALRAMWYQILILVSWIRQVRNALGS